MYEMPQTSMPPQLDFIRMPSQTVTWEPARVGLRPVSFLKVRPTCGDGMRSLTEGIARRQWTRMDL
jgi:hypothetical protein